MRSNYSTYNELMLEAQRIISNAEDKYTHQRFVNGGDITPAMEEEWYSSMKRAESIQAEAAREILSAYELDHQDDLQSQTEMRRG